MHSSMLILSQLSMIVISLVSQHLPYSVYYGNLPASACSADHVKVVARFRRDVWIDGFHELLEDHQRRQAANTAAIERQKAELITRHFLNDVPTES